MKSEIRNGIGAESQRSAIPKGLRLPAQGCEKRTTAKAQGVRDAGKPQTPNSKPQRTSKSQAPTLRRAGRASVWRAVTCHRFYRLANLSARQARVQRAADKSDAHCRWDGDKSPAESGDKSPHSIRSRGGARFGLRASFGFRVSSFEFLISKFRFNAKARRRRDAAKIQDPRSKIQINTKLQTSNNAGDHRARLGVWILELLWILDLGSWILDLFCPPQLRGRPSTFST
jgi:hypothetical protein